MIIEIKVDGFSYGEFDQESWMAYADDKDIDGSSIWLASLKEAALNNLKARHAAILRGLTGDETIEERDTWQPKLEAAKAFLKGEAEGYQVRLIEAEAGDEVPAQSALAQTIIARASAFHLMIGLAGRVRRLTKEAIAAADSIEALDAAIAVGELRAGEALNQFQIALAAAGDS